MILTLAVAIGFQDTTKIGNAYGKSMLKKLLYSAHGLVLDCAYKYGIVFSNYFTE